VPDDERRRRRLGDETKGRIADLASGWSLDGKDEPPPPKPAHTPTPQPKPTAPAKAESPGATAPPTRNKPRTNPPPPPGSAERKALEDKIVETARPPGVKTSTSANPVAGEARAKPPTSPPPMPRPSTRSGPQYRRAGYAGPSAPFATESNTPAVIIDDSISVDAVAPAPSKPLVLPLPPPMQSGTIKAPPSNPRLAVPVGEFDSGVQTIEQETQKAPEQARRDSKANVKSPEQATRVRDPAEALLKIPDKETPVEDLLEDDDEDESPARGDATTIDPMTARFERGDPTAIAPPDGTVLHGPSGRISHRSGGTLRPSAALRRKRGLAGDVRYVFTALFGARASRREIAELEHRQGLRQTSRRRHLFTLGRAAVITDSFDHPALGKAREDMQAIEDERSRHAGAVSASDAELERVRRDRTAKAKAYLVDLGALDTELADLTKKLEPLEKEALVARRRGQDLREQLQRIDKKMVDTELLLTSVKGEKLDKAGVLADIASLKADRQAVLRDEPTIAADLDALNPRIAAIEATRTELRKKRGELDKAEVEDQRRTAELLEAIGAKRKVVERAAADAEAARDNALFELGDRLYVDRPKMLAAQLSPIDQIDLELGEGDRRMMELKEILSNIDKAKFARGLAMIILVLGFVGSFVVWLLSMLL